MTVATAAAAIVLTIVYRFVCQRENERRDATGQLEAYDHAYEDDWTDRKVWFYTPSFRKYQLTWLYRTLNSDMCIKWHDDPSADIGFKAQRLKTLDIETLTAQARALWHATRDIIDITEIDATTYSIS